MKLLICLCVSHFILHALQESKSAWSRFSSNYLFRHISALYAAVLMCGFAEDIRYVTCDIVVCSCVSIYVPVPVRVLRMIKYLSLFMRLRINVHVLHFSTCDNLCRCV